MQEYLATQELLELRQRKQEKTLTPARFLDDPCGFIDTYVKFEEGGGLTPYQRSILSDLVEHRRLGVRGPRRMGKSSLASLAVLWFAITRDAAGKDWKIITTAASWLQLEAYFWKEVRKWAMRLDWEALGRPPFKTGDELQKHGMNLIHGSASAASPDTPDRIEGAHSSSIMFVFDEAKKIDASIFDSAEGSFAGGSRYRNREALALAISTPGSPSGRFYDIHRGALKNWHARHVTIEETVAAGQIDGDWVEQMRAYYGEQSAWFQQHVLGEFSAEEEDAVIPLSWVEAAVARWRVWMEDGAPEPDGPHTIGVDVARSGADRTVFAFRKGDVVTHLRASPKEDTMGTAGRIKAALEADPQAKAIIDTIGIGAGVYDRLREQNEKVESFQASRKTVSRDSTGQIRYANDRAAAWWGCRERLDPSRSPALALPDDPELTADLTSVHAKPMLSDGKLLIESKNDIRKRIGRSTDRADAVIQALWGYTGSWHDMYGTMMCPNEKCGRGFLKGSRTQCPYCREPLDVPEDESEDEPEPVTAG